MEFWSSFTSLIPVTLVQSLLYAYAALAIMLPFRVLNFPDLTSEGSFPLGAATCAWALVAGWHPLPAMGLAAAAGFAAGCATGWIHERVRVNTLLCGIIVLTMLYSINLRIMGAPNVPLFTYDSVFGLALGAKKGESWWQALFLGASILAAAGATLWFLRTRVGNAMRAVGASVPMARAQGVNVGAYTIAGLGLANAFAALSGALLAQNQGFADANLGFGVLINGLAAVILGETLVGTRSLARQVIAPLVGSLVYYQVISVALALGMRPSDLKFLTGLFVLVTLAIPAMRGGGEGRFRIRE
jgi:putative ABC transport system permease protein